ncbi:ComEC/Rec2 family competence protein [Pseudaminobacter sp. 19-2017]|uniref:ComEC/Rec2 family competence protein n=1 Tax=Pseudaminobacter soli (ex Zhang et al. 2022) TaxID=2831468 RepID=A0A942EA96_9HYPH|nr:ComEC/Rec2 family competence protein [Pseudaminobacter soli]MBS3651342.1 ComEC/Rec2 family competence protein [Pseudaminobacter soli]
MGTASFAAAGGEMAGTSSRESDERLLLGRGERAEVGVPSTDPTPGHGWREWLKHSWRARPRGPALGIVVRHAKHAFYQAVVLEVERGTPFLLSPVLLAIGAFTYFRLSFEPDLLVTIAVAAAVGAAALLTPRGRLPHYTAVATLLVVLGVLLGKVEALRAGTAMLGGEVTTRITGRVIGIDAFSEKRVRLTLDVLTTERPKLRYAPGRVRVTGRSVPTDVHAGDVVSGLVRLRPPPGPVRPDSYDFSFESYFDGIGASGFFLSRPERMTSSSAGILGRLSYFIENARNAIAARIRDRIGGAQGEIAAALMVGVRAGIPEEISESLRRTGLYHIISISGLHMALVAGAVIGSMRALLALFPGFASRWPVRKVAAVAGLAAIAFYLLISGGEVAAQRSFIMLAIMLTAVLFDRAALTMRNLALSALVVLALTPHEVVGPSFQMSFAATAALVAAYAFWNERRSKSAGRTPKRIGFAGRISRRAAMLIAGLVLTSLIAGLATAPYGVYHFQRVAPLSLAANLFAMPIVSAVVVPAGVAAAIFMPFGIEGPCLDLMGFGISAMLGVATWFSERSPIDVVGMISGLSVILFTLSLTAVAIATTWLRLVSVPLALAGLFTLDATPVPDVLVSEDAKLIGLVTQEGVLAVNLPRPNAFTVQNWQRALRADSVVKPRRLDAALLAGRTGVGDEVAKADAAIHDTADVPGLAAIEVGFSCAGTVCAARHPAGSNVVFTSDAEEGRRACSYAGIIVLTDATTPLHCAEHSVLVITARELARKGSAAVYLGRANPANGSAASDAGPLRPHVEYAVSTSSRPWHAHRVFSREARGLTPRPPKARTNVAAARRIGASSQSATETSP